MILCERNQSLLDISLMLEGSLENFYDNVMVKYSFVDVTEDITNVVIENPIYETRNAFVNSFLLKKRKVVTSENFDIAPIRGAYSDGFSDGFDID